MILVTGATGLVGTQLCQDLLESGQTVRAMRRTTSTIPIELEDMEWVQADLLDEESLEASMRDTHTIIHTAAMISFYPGDRDLLHQVNVIGTRNLVNAALKSQVSTIVYVSSVGALGRSDHQVIINERTPWQSSKNTTYYGETKYLAELEVWRAMEEGMQVAIVNPSVILGRGNWEQGSTRLFKYASEEHLFFPMGKINYVDNRDVSDCIRTILQKELFGQKFILSGGQTTFKNFFSCIAIQMRKRPPRLPLSPKLYFIVIWVAAAKAFLTRSKPFVTRESLLSGRKEYLYDASNTEKMLNFAFRNLDDSIEWVCKRL